MGLVGGEEESEAHTAVETETRSHFGVPKRGIGKVVDTDGKEGG